MTIKLYPPEFLFPTKILLSEDTNFSSYRDDMIQWMIDYSYKHETVGKSNQGGYQSPDQFYLEESFAPYLNRISEHLISTIDEYTRDDKSCLHLDDLKLSNMWFNFNYENCYNVQHTHPGCVLSEFFGYRLQKNNQLYSTVLMSLLVLPMKNILMNH